MLALSLALSLTLFPCSCLYTSLSLPSSYGLTAIALTHFLLYLFPTVTLSHFDSALTYGADRVRCKLATLHDADKARTVPDASLEVRRGTVHRLSPGRAVLRKGKTSERATSVPTNVHTAGRAGANRPYVILTHAEPLRVQAPRERRVAGGAFASALYARETRNISEDARR